MSYNLEYERERERGYEYREDLFKPGYFEVILHQGESIVFTAGLTGRVEPAGAGYFEDLMAGFRFFMDRKPAIMPAGSSYWKLRITRPSVPAISGSVPGRDTCIAMPGLTLIAGNTRLFEKTANSLIADLHMGLLPNTGTGEKAVCNSADAALWFIWSLTEYSATFCDACEDMGQLRCCNKNPFSKIIATVRRARRYGVRWLIYAANPGEALTWMDAVCDGVPVTREWAGRWN